MTAPTKDITLFDTDMFLNHASPDEKIKSASATYFLENQPTGICSFSLVELKGNYLQDLALLYKKLSTSDNFKEAVVKVQNTGGRKATLMLGQLIECVGGINYQINPWAEAKRELLSLVDSQIASSLDEFREMADFFLDDLHCDRARELPEDEEGTWKVSIPHCKKNNTNCKIQHFMNEYFEQLKKLVFNLSNSGKSSEFSTEIRKMLSVAQETLQKHYFPYEGRTCRAVGDLIIGLHGIKTRALISSNYKEHDILCESLDYKFFKFPVSSIRSK